jgi:hypothetical protein
MGQAVLFTPPPIHKSNVVVLPAYFQQKRLKQFVKSIEGTYITNNEGLITVVNDTLEFHYKVYNRHIELIELTCTPSALPDTNRCLEFLKYESYLLQKPVYFTTSVKELVSTLVDQGFRLIEDELERSELYQQFWVFEEDQKKRNRA